MADEQPPTLAVVLPADIPEAPPPPAVAALLPRKTLQALLSSLREPR